MNIFILDDDVKNIAMFHCDVHLNKMIVETAQLLSSAHHLCGGEELQHVYRKTHPNHPSAIWVRETDANYVWTVSLLETMLEEYTYRRDKTHGTSLKLPYLKKIPKNIPMRGERTSFALAMPEELKSSDVVKSYRNYYQRKCDEWAKTSRPGPMKYTRRDYPEWLIPPV